jgi:hypothetical protein
LEYPDLTPNKEPTDEQLVSAANAGLGGQGAGVEMMRRLRVSITEQYKATTELNEKLLQLNRLLLYFTIGLYFIGGVQLLLFVYQLFLSKS